jgi:crotonobetainyl-CoA:carnitine CoA-transferase CaiB-like acyl-CoA transferase
VQFDDDDALRGELDAIFARHPAADWIERFIAWEVPGAEILSPAEVLEHPHFRARHLLDDAAGGDDAVPAILDPVVCAETGTRPGTGAPPSPALGEHTDEIMKTWLADAERN